VRFHPKKFKEFIVNFVNIPEIHKVLYNLQSKMCLYVYENEFKNENKFKNPSKHRTVVSH